VVVRFVHAEGAFEVQMSPTIDQDTLSEMWDYVRAAYHICEQFRVQGVFLDKIRILPDGTRKMLVIGYEGNHPKYTVDLDNKALRPIATATPTIEANHEIAGQIWLIEQLLNRLNYLRMLYEYAETVEQDVIQELRQLIANEKAKLEEYE
jgi:hypothetical protein